MRNLRRAELRPSRRATPLTLLIGTGLWLGHSVVGCSVDTIPVGAMMEEGSGGEDPAQGEAGLDDSGSGGRAGVPAGGRSSPGGGRGGQGTAGTVPAAGSAGDGVIGGAGFASNAGSGSNAGFGNSAGSGNDGGFGNGAGFAGGFGFSGNAGSGFGGSSAGSFNTAGSGGSFDGSAGEFGQAGSDGAQQCHVIEAIEVSCSCAGEQQCFTVSDSFAVCGDLTEATTCTQYPDLDPQRDECGCDGKTCPDGQTCHRIHETLSGGWYEQNRCYSTCEEQSDCTPGEACLPDRFGVPTCVTPECTTDADCTEDDCGHCIQDQWPAFQTSIWWKGLPRCVYENGDDTCSGAESVQFPLSEPPAMHACHPWDPAARL